MGYIYCCMSIIIDGTHTNHNEHIIGDAMDKKKMSTMPELCSYLDVSEYTLRRWMREGAPHIRFGPKCVRFDLADFSAWLKSTHGVNYQRPINLLNTCGR